MENKKDIGKLFKSKLNGLDKSPNEKLWSSIHAELQEKKKKRRIVPFWFISSSIAVAIFLFTGILTRNIFQQAFDVNSSIENNRNLKNDVNIINSDNSIKKVNKYNSQTTKDINSTLLNSDVKNKYKSTAKVDLNSIHLKAKNKYSKKYKNKANKSQNLNVHVNTEDKSIFSNENNPDLAFENLDGNLEISLEAENKKDSLINKIKDKKEGKILAEKKTDSVKNSERKFYVFTHISPTIYDYLSKKSAIDNRLDNNETVSEVNYNFGAYVGFYLSKKLNLRIGVNSTSMTLTTKNTQLQSFGETPEISGYFSNVSYSTLITNDELATVLNDSNINLHQKLSYFEVPIEAKYRILDKKIGIEAIAGFSTLYLRKNDVIAKANDASINLGSISSVKKINFSGNIGIEFDYKLTKNIQLNVEPMFKYYFSPFDNNPKPYSLNLQTGIQYIFGK
jgi:uncharacterized protein with PQ loop repeat